MPVFGQGQAGLATQGQGGRQIHVVGRRAALRRDVARGQSMNGPGLRAGLNRVDDDGPLVADHLFHQAESAPVVFGHVDVGPIG